MIFPRWFTLCASVLLCAGTLLLPAKVSAESGAVMDDRTIYKMSKGSDLCVLTFDDGPSQYTDRLMQILRERGIHATFFVLGSQVKRHPELVVRLQQEGHEIGNHTYNHRSLRHLNIDAQKNEIINAQNALRNLGIEARYIRPPYGNYDNNTIDIAKSLGADLVLWSIDSKDWARRASIEGMQGLNAGRKLRGVFLFHDTHEQTIEALPEILDRLLADGCQFVTVSQYLTLLKRDALPEGIKVAEPIIPAQLHPTPAVPVTPAAAEATGTAGTEPATAAATPAATVPATAAPAEKPESQTVAQQPAGQPAAEQPAAAQQPVMEDGTPQLQPGDVHEIRQPLAPKPTPEQDQLAGHSATDGSATPDAQTSVL